VVRRAAMAAILYFIIIDVVPNPAGAAGIPAQAYAGFVTLSKWPSVSQDDPKENILIKPWLRSEQFFNRRAVKRTRDRVFSNISSNLIRRDDWRVDQCMTADEPHRPFVRKGILVAAVFDGLKDGSTLCNDGWGFSIVCNGISNKDIAWILAIPELVFNIQDIEARPLKRSGAGCLLGGFGAGFLGWLEFPYLFLNLNGTNKDKQNQSEYSEPKSLCIVTGIKSPDAKASEQDSAYDREPEDQQLHSSIPQHDVLKLGFFVFFAGAGIGFLFGIAFGMRFRRGA
jgi:hypothetical protein